MPGFDVIKKIQIFLGFFGNISDVNWKQDLADFLLSLIDL